MKHFSETLITPEKVCNLSRELSYSLLALRPNFKSLLLVFTIISFNSLSAQSSTYSLAGKGSGSGGSFTNNIGEVVFLEAKGTGGSASSGILLPREFYRVDIDDRFVLDNIQVYPTCISSEVTVELNAGNNEMYRIKLINLNGQELYSVDGVESELTIDMSLYGSGLYFIQVMHQDLSLQTFKVIKN